MIHLLEDMSGIASDNNIRWKRFGDDSPSAHNDSFAQLDARENDGVRTDPAILADANRLSGCPGVTQVSRIMIGANDPDARAEHHAISKLNAVGRLNVTAEASGKAHADEAAHGDAFWKHDARRKVYSYFTGAVNTQNPLSNEIGYAHTWIWNESTVSQASREASDAGDRAKDAK